jgi:hypothetical protein
VLIDSGRDDLQFRWFACSHRKTVTSTASRGNAARQ